MYREERSFDVLMLRIWLWQNRFAYLLIRVTRGHMRVSHVCHSFVMMSLVVWTPVGERQSLAFACRSIIFNFQLLIFHLQQGGDIFVWRKSLPVLTRLRLWYIKAALTQATILQKKVVERCSYIVEKLSLTSATTIF